MAAQRPLFSFPDKAHQRMLAADTGLTLWIQKARVFSQLIQYLFPGARYPSIDHLNPDELDTSPSLEYPISMICLHTFYKDLETYAAKIAHHPFRAAQTF